VPGFYDGDGCGGPDGIVWNVRFSAEESGEWTFTSPSADASLNGWTATFTLTAAPADAPGIYRAGRPWTQAVSLPSGLRADAPGDRVRADTRIRRATARRPQEEHFMVRPRGHEDSAETTVGAEIL